MESMNKMRVFSKVKENRFAAEVDGFSMEYGNS